MKYLTKSRFKLAIECPKKLLYTTNTAYKNTKNDDGFLKSLADGGFQVGELAKKLYPFGIEIKEKNSEKALIETAKELEKDHVVLFEPAIAYNNLLVRIDILVKRGDVFELIEVKAKSIDSKNDQFVTTKGDKNTIKGSIKPYVEDVAFQTYVLKNAFPQARVTSYLLMPDKSEVATIDQMNQFFKVKRVGNNVETIAAVVPIINIGGDEYAKIGAGKSTGTKLMSACGNINKPACAPRRAYIALLQPQRYSIRSRDEEPMPERAA